MAFPNQPQLFCAGKALEGGFPAQRRRLLHSLLAIAEHYRPAAAGLFGAPSAVMGRQPPGDIIGAAGIQRPVPAFQHIDPPAHSVSPFFPGIDRFGTKKPPQWIACGGMARCKGFEPLAFWSVARRSIQLS